jgi:hypothetical protein
MLGAKAGDGLIWAGGIFDQSGAGIFPALTS